MIHFRGICGVNYTQTSGDVLLDEIEAVTCERCLRHPVVDWVREYQRTDPPTVKGLINQFLDDFIEFGAGPVRVEVMLSPDSDENKTVHGEVWGIRTELTTGQVTLICRDTEV